MDTIGHYPSTLPWMLAARKAMWHSPVSSDVSWSATTANPYSCTYHIILTENETLIITDIGVPKKLHATQLSTIPIKSQKWVPMWSINHVHVVVVYGIGWIPNDVCISSPTTSRLLMLISHIIDHLNQSFSPGFVPHAKGPIWGFPSTGGPKKWLVHKEKSH